MPTAFFDRWFPNELPNYDGFQAAVAAVVPATGKILDVGCGANTYLACWRGPGREVWGTDLQQHPQLAHAEWFRLMPRDGTIPFDDGSFDVVTSFMVAEHVADPHGFLREIARVLRPGGCLIVHTISAWHYVTWIRRMLGVLPHRWVQYLVRAVYGREAYDTFPTYYRMNTPGRIARRARPLGFEFVGVNRYAFPGYFGFSALLCRAAIVADWALDRFLPGLGRIYFTATYRKAPLDMQRHEAAPASAAAHDMLVVH